MVFGLGKMQEIYLFRCVGEYDVVGQVEIVGLVGNFFQFFVKVYCIVLQLGYVGIVVQCVKFVGCVLGGFGGQFVMFYQYDIFLVQFGQVIKYVVFDNIVIDYDNLGVGFYEIFVLGLVLRVDCLLVQVWILGGVRSWLVCCFFFFVWL